MKKIALPLITLFIGLFLGAAIPGVSAHPEDACAPCPPCPGAESKGEAVQKAYKALEEAEKKAPAQK